MRSHIWDGGLAMMKSYTEGRLLLPWLCSAALVTVLRFLNVSELGYDLPLQIQVAQNLLAGKGLSWYWHMGSGYWRAGPDLTEPAKLFTCTHYPCGYSLYAAALLAMGVSGGGGKLLGRRRAAVRPWGDCHL